MVIVTASHTATVLHPQRFDDVAATLTRLFASAALDWHRSSQGGSYDPP